MLGNDSRCYVGRRATQKDKPTNKRSASLDFKTLCGQSGALRFFTPRVTLQSRALRPCRRRIVDCLRLVRMCQGIKNTSMDDKLCFVQFIHPGGEHQPDDGLRKGWNRGNHRRKFLRQSGRYLAGTRVETGEMLYWGEWEPESEAQRIDNPIDRGPRFIHVPYYVVPRSYRGLQNTDPFVFGEQFHYTGCQQRTTKSATQLRYLSEGSVILFGSCEDRNEFVLDTVFVVDRWIDHSRLNYRRVLGGAISPEYEEVTVCP